MSTAIEKISELMKELPRERQREVIDFAEYLRYRQIEEAGTTSQIVEGIQQVKDRRFRPARDLLPNE